MVVEKLSNLAIDISCEAWWPTFPSECFELVRNDAMGFYSICSYCISLPFEVIINIGFFFSLINILILVCDVSAKEVPA